MGTPRVIFDAGPLAGGSAFSAPLRLIRADTPAEVPGALAAMAAAQAAGHWLAGCASYELGYVFSSKLRGLLPAARSVPLLLFGVFDGPSGDVRLAEGAAGLSAPEPEWSFDEYAAAFGAVHAQITRGEIYQGNLTFPMSARWSGSAEALYGRLKARQAAPHGAFVDLGGPVLLSRSPELFFSLDASGRMVARPMKGTVARGLSAAEDAERVAWMRGSEKNRAENLMIVDLLRNDMSRISEVGSVRVPQLYTVETYATLHQMVSEVTAQVRAGVGIAEIFEALFPCGSITGAPKIRAMQILRGLEGAARDAYCGAIGWIAPGGEMAFSVAIRTLMCFADGTARLNVGGGIVYDSTAEEEYGEALLKARFAVLE
ncbi:aminodeoxychorismate synthase component I [Puniceibacterium sediminis]|uniref:Para-aminobenzoate synthetase component 1 n=1 Tax=Puniceibacterium sediminis TaxID=1608407 RepID=A0A238Y6Z1_9RHOB|nr:aminodeoxychorismate synthase component I [Puniceibacterium sediminis]SNR66099.1 para-aminobenzoate synthetase component 1 [Puniceibacterium sediminis]